jgi:hypothetical protein
MLVLKMVAPMKTDAMTHHDFVRAFNSCSLALGFILPITKNKSEAKVKMPKISATTMSKS